MTEQDAPDAPDDDDPEPATDPEPAQAGESLDPEAEAPAGVQP